MSRKPNLLFIFTDQQRVDTLRCYGNTLIQAQALDSLAEVSFVFENAYVTQPVCTPSRSSILTGLYPHTNGCISNNLPLRPDTRTIAEMVSPDYLCAYFGKWHLGDEVIPQHGFEKWVSAEDLYRSNYSREEYLSRFSDYHYFLLEQGFKPDITYNALRLENGFAPVARGGETMVFGRYLSAGLPEQLSKAAFLGREAARFIRENQKRPFLMYVSYLEPHMPYTGPFDKMYPPLELPVGPHFLQKPPRNASFLHRLMADLWMQSEYEGHDLGTEAGWRQIRAHYWGLVTLVSRSVGEILRALEECELADNTIVVYTSDHGDLLGDHGIFDKSVQYEEAVKVPLLVTVPWLGKQQRRVKGRVSQVDLVPTLLDLMEEPICPELPGESRKAVFYDVTKLDKNSVIIEWNGRSGRPDQDFATDISVEEKNRVWGTPWRTIASGDGWKLNLSSADQCELYDLMADPYEQNNLFDDPNQKNRIRDQVMYVRRWQERVKDDAPLPSI